MDPRPRSLPGTGPMVLIVGAAAVIVMAGLRDIGSLFGPVFFALTLAVSTRPLAAWLARHHVPRWLGNIVVLLLLYAVLLGMAFVIGLSVAQLADTMPAYGDRFGELWNEAAAWLATTGVHTPDLDALSQNFNFGSILGIVQGVLASVQSFGTMALFILVSLAFLVLDTSDVTARAGVLRSTRPALVEALEDFTWRVRKYWVYSAIFGVILAVGDYVALLALGVPLALSWAIMAFICNFIPNIGFVIAVIPPALLALLDDGPGHMLSVIVAYSVVNFVVQTLMLPKFMGDAVGLNTTTTFMSLVFWTGIIGALGAILAIPLTLFFKAILIDSTPSLRWLDTFISSQPSAVGPTPEPAPKPPAEPGADPVT